MAILLEMKDQKPSVLDARLVGIPFYEFVAFS